MVTQVGVEFENSSNRNGQLTFLSIFGDLAENKLSLRRKIIIIRQEFVFVRQVPLLSSAHFLSVRFSKTFVDVDQETAALPETLLTCSVARSKQKRQLWNYYNISILFIVILMLQFVNMSIKYISFFPLITFFQGFWSFRIPVK